MPNIGDLRNFQADRMDLEQLVSLAAFGRSLRDEYEHLNLDEPDWIGSSLKALKREINARNSLKLEARRKEIDARLEGMKSPTQRKSDLLRERAEIDKQRAEIDKQLETV